MLALPALLAFPSFAIGDYVMGLKSPGRTIVKPGISAAVVLELLVGGALTVGSLLTSAVMPFLAGLLGAWLGEVQQPNRPPPSHPP